MDVRDHRDERGLREMREPMGKAMATDEIVACAAIQLKNGLIVAGHRHHNCLSAINLQDGMSKNDVEAQGFMTTRGRFVGRREAQRIQQLADIPSASPDGYRGVELYSEDLY